MPPLPLIRASHESIQVPSLSSSLWVLATTLSLSVFPLLALYALKRWDDHIDQSDRSRRRGAAGGQGNSDYWSFPPSTKCGDDVITEWYFPPKEDRAARFRRWAELLRFKPREGRPPVAPLGLPKDFSVEVAIEAFSEGDEKVQLENLTAPKPNPVFPGRAKPLGSLDRYAVLADGVATSLMNQLGPQSDNSDEGRRRAATLREKVKARILRFLIECGPPKGLTPIVETEPYLERSSLTPNHAEVAHFLSEESQEQEHKREDDPSVHVDIPDVHACPGPQQTLALNKLDMSPSVGNREPSRLYHGRKAMAVAALADGEAVMRTRSGGGVTREVLWAAMACIDAPAAVDILAQAPQQEEEEGEEEEGKGKREGEREQGELGEGPLNGVLQDEQEALVC